MKSTRHRSPVAAIVWLPVMAAFFYGMAGNAEEVSAEDKSAIQIETRGNFVNQSYQNVWWALSKMPRRYKDYLWSMGYHVVLYTSVDDYQKSHNAKPLHNQEHPEWTYKNLMGETLHDKQKIVIGETYLNKPVNNKVLFHESGHAFDFSKKISGSNAFIAAFREDGGHPQGQGFAWKSRTEVCAQLVAVELIKRANIDVSDNQRLTPKFSEAWPHCAEIVRQELQPYL